MKIIHENMPEEAVWARDEFRNVFNLESEIISRDFSDSFIPINKFKGYFESYDNLRSKIRELGGERVIVLTSRDLYFRSYSKDDDWIFGYSAEEFAVVSSARMKRRDSQPSEKVEVDYDLYRQRVVLIAIHELGHNLVKSGHMKQATWVNTKAGYSLPLGLHCTDNKCVMYEIVDIRAPPADEGYMLLGEDRKYDAGMDDVIERRYSDWFCKKCRDSLVDIVKDISLSLSSQRQIEEILKVVDYNYGGNKNGMGK